MRLIASHSTRIGLMALMFLQTSMASAYVSSREDFVKFIQSSIKMDKGISTGSRACDPGTFVFGFAQKVQPNQGSGDDTALNDIELYCTNGYQLDRFTLPGATEFGEWGPITGCRDGYVVGFQQKVETSGGDNSAVNSISLQCDSGESIKTINEGPWGTWSTLKLCPIGTAVCGVEAYIQPPQGDNDDTSVNDISLMCCKF